jgi:hypothetical protein
MSQPAIGLFIIQPLSSGQILSGETVPLNIVLITFTNTKIAYSKTYLSVKYSKWIILRYLTEAIYLHIMDLSWSSKAGNDIHNLKVLSSEF